MHHPRLKTSLLFCIGTLTLAAASSATRAGDWPCWRGPTGLGLSAENDLPLTWGGKANGHVLWKVPLPGADGKARPDQNQSSPVVWHDRVFLTTSFWPAGVGQKEYPEHHVSCFEADDGKQLWDTLVPPGPWKLSDLRGGYTAPTPATDGERVYVVFGSSVLAALDLQGKMLWRKEIVPYTFDVAIGSSPLLYHDTVILLCADPGKKNSRLLALEKKSGDVQWEQKRPTMGFAHSTPVIIDVKGRPQLIVCASGGGTAPDALLGMDPGDGKVVWWCKGSGDAASPAYGSGVVYCDSGRGGPGVAVDPAGVGDVTRSNTKWTIPQVPQGLSSPLIVGDYVYRVHEPGILKCWKVATGEQVYAERLAGISAWSSPIADADQRVYFANTGRSYVIKAGPRLEILATNDLGDEGRASAAASNGRLFLKGQRSLYSIGKK